MTAPAARAKSNDGFDTRIRALTSWSTALPAAESPEWYGRLLASLELLVGDQPVEYLSGELTQDDGHLSARLVAYTHSFLVRAKAWGASGTELRTSATAVSRTGLILMAASGTGGDSPAGDLTVSLSYRGEGEAVVLPLEVPQGPHWAAEWAALLQGLRDDLAGR
jgi:hypothetical protein